MANPMKSNFETTSIFPLFLSGFHCAFQCAYCNCRIVNAHEPPIDHPGLTAGIDSWIEQHASDRRLIAMYGNDIPSLPHRVLSDIYRVINPYMISGKIHGIRISARPDTAIRFIESAGMPIVSVELGCQTLNDKALILIRRGHSAQDVWGAVKALKALGKEIGLQTMIGLPGTPPDEHLDTAVRIIRMKPNFVRIHPTLVLRHTVLEYMWQSGDYEPMKLDEAVRSCCSITRMYRDADINVARIGYHIPAGDLGDVLCAGPYHPSFSSLVTGELAFEKATEYLAAHPDITQLRVPPHQFNDFIGYRKRNLQRLRELHCSVLAIAADPRSDLKW